MLMPSDAVAQLFDNEFARQGAVSRRGSGGMTTAAADSHPSPPASPGTESEKQPANCGRLEESMRALRADMERIISTYLLQDSAKEINLPDVLRKRILNEVRENNNLHPDLFKGAIENVTTMMRLSSFPNFLKQALLVDPRPPLTKKLTIEQKVNFAGFPHLSVLVFLRLPFLIAATDFVRCHNPFLRITFVCLIMFAI
ncbi:hypothetical protein DFJ77DRAFT_470815 [Powellomyces hirtus]|nr:hypothetical protein DFJ77DRAFT_470815 [Powellomyces hirtus]